MTQEYKELLLRDLTARLPDHVRCKIWLKDGTTEEGLLDLEHNYGDVLRDAFYYNKIVDIKPYLRPMSSMTKDEVGEYISLKEDIVGSDGITYFFETYESIDWLNKKMFAYRTIDGKDMFELGIALQAPKGMYNN